MSGNTAEPERVMLRKWAEHAAENGGSFAIRQEWTESQWYTTYTINWPDGNYVAPMLVKKTTLAELVAYCLEGWRNGDGYTDDDHVPASDALAAALRAAADMLDSGKRHNS